MLVALLACFAQGNETCLAQTSSGNQATNEIRIAELQGTVEVSPAGATTWVLTQTNQVLRPADRLRVGSNSRVALRWSDQSIVRFGASTELEILPAHSPGAQSGLQLIRGIMSFFHRDKPGRIRVITRGAAAGVEGTEFVMEVSTVDNTERTTLYVVDGRVRLSNEQGSLVLTNGQSAVADLGQAPVRTAGFIANNVLQWCFYYPAVLDLAELPMTKDEQTALAESLDAYRAGDLLAALAKYPATRRPGSDAERVYHAALLLSVGQVDSTEAELELLSGKDASDRPQRLAAALRQLISAVKRQSSTSSTPPQLATEFLASSYYEQSRATPGVSLNNALNLARQAVTNSPQFGFGWARVAELEFSFGHTRTAIVALDKALTLTPRNAQALTLKGFLLAARNQTHEAVTWFDRAIAVDSALGNAWLGRGLCRIRHGDAAGGREDLLVAAALEPQRAGLRSYLGKAYANAGDSPRATKELQLAKDLDPNDPTAWLYSALLNQEHNRINEAIRDLEKSQELNDNRSVYRSQLLLDQDRAVRGANLAAMYQDAGMDDVSVREAARAVNTDYANYSAHLFLANSYLGLSDPNLINLRYETPAQNEYLLANLLAPVSAGTISPTISQQEYSRFFERNRIGVVSITEYLSRGAWTQAGAQYGIFGNFSYDFEAFYRYDPGQRVNNDTEQRQLSLALKHQITPQDSVYLQIKHYEAESGDISQHYDPTNANPVARVKETQEPIVGLGYHHEWSPGVHTLLYVTWLDDTLSVANPAGPTSLANRPDGMSGDPELFALWNIRARQELVNELEIYSGELQQIWQQPDHNTILGARVQYGHIETQNRQIDVASPYAGFFSAPPAYAAQQDFTSLFKRFSIYGYHQWQILDSLQLLGGLSYDHLTFPENFQSAPVSNEEKAVDQVSPKAGAIWKPAPNSTIRFAYAQSLSGASLDQSYQLEPSQVAGFVQSFRSIIPESVEGPIPGVQFETYGLSLEHKFHTKTYLGISGDLLSSEVHRTVGAFDALDAFAYAVPSELRQDLDYEEKSLLVTLNQLLGEEWALGARYRLRACLKTRALVADEVTRRMVSAIFIVPIRLLTSAATLFKQALSRAVLKKDFVNVPDGLPFNDANSPQARERLKGILHSADLFAVYNHPCGFFAEGHALWYDQQSNGYTSGLPSDNFWQFNTFAGYRFARRKGEVTVGLLNLTDQNYRLNPLNLYSELPRERTVMLRLRLNF